MDFDPDFYKKLSRARQKLLKLKFEFTCYDASKIIRITTDNFIEPFAEQTIHYYPQSPMSICGIMCLNNNFNVESLLLGAQIETFICIMSGQSLKYRKIEPRWIYSSNGIRLKIRNICGKQDKPEYLFIANKILNCGP